MKTKVKIVYHIAQMRPHWESIYREQCALISEFIRPEAIGCIMLTVLGTKPLDYLLPGAVIAYQSPDFKEYEFPALRFAQSTQPGTPVLYLHTKGSSRPDIPKVREWRRYMQWACVEHLPECVNALAKGADVAGTEWHAGGWPVGSARPQTGECAGFFAGNFWVASSDYLRTLPLPDNDGNRWRAEGWIGTGNPKYFEMHNTGSRATNNKGMFADGFSRVDYTSDPLPVAYNAVG